MRNIVSCLLFLLIINVSFAQQNLTGSARNSEYTYIYRITPKETGILFHKQMKGFRESFLHTLTDSFRTYSTVPKLSAGNYLLVNTVAGKLNIEQFNNGPLQWKLIKNNYDLLLYVHDLNGKPAGSAVVSMGGKKARYLPQAALYQIPSRRKGGTVKILQEGTAYFFPVKNDRSVSWGRKLISTTFHPFRKKYGRQLYYNFVSSNTYYERKYRGFMVFNKPVFRPNDTLHGKAWITNANGKPVDRPLLLRISDRDFFTDTIVATIHPYRPGGYEFSVVLNDSLDLLLDDNYLVTLEEESSRKFKVDEDAASYEQDRIALKRKVLVRKKFEFEEYELNSIKFNARTDKEKHNSNNAPAVYCKAVDENGLPVLDGSVKIIVEPQSGTFRFQQDSIFIKDTIWVHEQALEQVGETRIQLPDSIFPAASFSYTIHCVFLNTNNERQTQNLYQQYFHRQRMTSTAQTKDSLLIGFNENGLPVSGKATLIMLNQKQDTITRFEIDVPAKLKIDPFAKTYMVLAQDTTQFSPDRSQAAVTCFTGRTKDSIFIQTSNPYGLPCWYTIFAGKKKIAQGRADSLLYTAATHTRDNYFVSLQYVFGDVSYKDDYTIPYFDKQLQVHLQLPEYVYPGQRTTIEVEVKDAEGRLVDDADLTLFGFTSRFPGNHDPALPYLGKTYAYRQAINTFREREAESLHGTKPLDWQKWSSRLGLDSIEYYKFLYPRDYYLNAEPVSGNITQVAPFVTSKGTLPAIFMLYIDEQPWFYADAEQWQQYSFPVKPGKHSFRIRTRDRMIYADSIMVEGGKKTIVSFNIDKPSQQVRVEKRPFMMTKEEKDYWSRYLILLEEPKTNGMVYLQQNDRYLLPRSGSSNYWWYSGVRNAKLLGPLMNSNANYVLKNEFVKPFAAQGSNEYKITEHQVQLKQWPLKFTPFNFAFEKKAHPYDLYDRAITSTMIDSLWEDYLNQAGRQTERRLKEFSQKSITAKLRISQPVTENGAPLTVRNLLLFSYDNPDFIQIYRGNTTDFGRLPVGKYKLVLMLMHNRYFIRENIVVKPGGTSYYALGTIQPKESDSMSKAMTSLLVNADQNAQKINYQFNSRQFEVSYSSLLIKSGMVMADDSPLAGVTVHLKNTRIATTTNQEGFFALAVSPGGTLVFSAVGYDPVEIPVDQRTTYRVNLFPAENHLEEVVVTGYGVKRKMSYTASSVTTVTENFLSGPLPGIMIRGTQSINSGYQPIQAATNIAEIPVPEEAFGASGNSLRKNFRDYAYWFPQLRTNQYGKASAEVVFPDDITNWKTYALAATGQKQSGQTTAPVRSFKAVAGTLHLPNFAVAGDQLQVLGKAMNYGKDSVTLQRSFFVNGQLAAEKSSALKYSQVDSFTVFAKADTMKLAYSIHRADGYMDGEERKIPVFPVGVNEAVGFFTMSDKDTAISWKPQTGGVFTFHATSSVMPAVLDELDHIDRYEYDCNEQMASKLKSLLLRKKVNEMLKQPFREERKIREIINKLERSKSPDGAWGWWKNTPATLWVTQHVIEAMQLAEREGFRTQLDKRKLTDLLVYTLNSRPSRASEQLHALKALRELNAKVDYELYLDSMLKRKTSFKTLYETLGLFAFQQQIRPTSVPDSLIHKHNNTAFGNIYWGEEGYQLFNNAVQNTLLMYRILRADGRYPDMLKKIRRYFLEKRKDGHWRNTYESVQVLETILPDLLKEREQNLPSSLVVQQGNRIETVTAFPATIAFNDKEELKVVKKGSQPVYITASQTRWNTNPAKQENNFSVSAAFLKGNDTLAVLKAGEPVLLSVDVEVKGDASYVMVEIPIPAGCSYNGKPQPARNNEVHREYFLNKVSLFCTELTKGRYTFTVSLLPRYSGSYHLNPATASMMYFPVFSGREGMKSVNIR